MMQPKYLAENLPGLRRQAGRIKVVYTDLDNTLLGPGASLFVGPDHEYSVEPARALIELMKAGIDVVPVSGRNNAQLREVCRLIGLTNYIAELGCLIYYNQGREILTNHEFTMAAGKNLHESITGSGAPALLLSTFHNRLEYHTPWSSRQECTHLFRGLIDIDRANNLLIDEGFSGLRVVDNGQIKNPGTLPPLPQVHAYHLLPKEASKVSAIRSDQRKRGFSPEETIAIGDSRADLEMAGAVGSFFLVSNDFASEPALERELLTHDNSYVASKTMGLGWAEVAALLLPKQAASE